RPTTHIHTLSLHDALPIFLRSTILPALGKCTRRAGHTHSGQPVVVLNFTPPSKFLGDVFLARSGSHSGFDRCGATAGNLRSRRRSEEHTSELQSRENLVCR